MVSRALRQEMVDAAEHRVCDRDQGFLLPAMAHDPAIACGQGAVLSAGGGEGGFNEGHAQPAVPLPGLSGFMLAGTFVVTGTEPGPAGEVPITREAAHVHADLRDDHLRRPPRDPRDG